MHLRTGMVGTLIALAAAYAPVRGDDAKPTAPAVVVRLKSFDGLMTDAKYLAGLAGQEEQAKQAEGMIRALAGPKGLAGTGIDTTRPFGLYGIVTPAGVDSYAALLIPVADEKAFIETVKDLLGRFGAKVSDKGNDNVYTVNIPGAPVDAYFTIADRYAYVTAKDKEALDPAKRVAPSKVFPADDPALASVTLRIDQIPDQIKQIALSHMENRLAELKEHKAPNETSAQAKLKAQIVDYDAQRIKALLADGQTLDARLVIDRTKDEFSAQLGLTAKPGSALAKDLQALAQRTSQFGGLSDPAFQVNVNAAVPAELRDAFTAVIDEGFRKAVEKEKDPKKKEMARKAFDVLGPTLKTGQFDLLAGLVGPDAGGHYTGVAALKVVDGKAIDQLARELVPMIPEKERAAVRFDVTTIAGAKVHAINPPANEIPADERRVFGDKPSARVAFTNDAAYLALGADPESALKAVMESHSARHARPFALEASVSRLAPLDKNAGPAAKQVAQDVFGANPQGKDLLRISVDGGTSLRVRATLKAQTIRFGVKLKEKTESSQ